MTKIIMANMTTMMATAATVSMTTTIKGLKTLLPWLTFWLLIWSILTFRSQPQALIIAVAIGVVGTLLIFATEMGYSYRKEGLLKWGKVAHWLRAHVAMGIAGPAIVIWHTGGEFYGFAGLLTAFTLVIVCSGFVGRYLYRLVPRSIKGNTLTLNELKQQAVELDGRLADLRSRSLQTHVDMPDTGLRFGASSAPGGPENDVMTPLAFAQSEMEWRRQLRAYRSPALRNASREDELLRQLRDLNLERAIVERRMAVLKTSKVLLGRWKTLHIFMTLVLFAGIVIHVFSIIYYGRALP